MYNCGRSNVVAANTGYGPGEESIRLPQPAAARLAAEMAPMLDRYDLALPAWRILAQLWLRGTTRMGSLANRLSIEVGTMSRTVARPETRGLIVRPRAALDRRATKLLPTEEAPV